MSSSNNLNYREALALNNMAVTLMENGCFEQASSTLGNSLTLMQMAFVPQDQIKKRRAERSFGKSSARCFTCASNSLEAMEMYAEIEPVSDADIVELRAAVNYGPSATVVFPIRISEFSNWNTNKVDTELITKQLGIILYNQALAAFVLSTQNSSNDNERKHSRRAQKLLKMAKTSLMASSNDVSSADSSVLLLLALSLNVMSAIFQSQNLSSKVLQAQRAVSSLCSSVDEQFTLAATSCDMTMNPCSAADIRSMLEPTEPNTQNKKFRM